MSILDKFRGQKPPKTSKIEVTRNVRVKDADGVFHAAEAGNVFDVPKSDADYLVSIGAASRILSDEEKAEVERIGALIPPPHEPRPLPESWAKLPACFAKWWALAERLRCLQGRQVEIEACYIRGNGLSKEELHWLRHDTGAGAGPQAQRAELVDNWLRAHPVRVLTPTAAELEDKRRLRDAMVRAGEAIDTFLEEHRAELAELKFECGQHLQKASWRLRSISTELATTGFEIFKARISALKLGPRKVAELFQGSADSLKFSHPVDKLAGERFGWTEDDGQRVTYVDRPVPAMATLLPRYEAEAKRLEALLREAKRELKAAQDSPAARPSIDLEALDPTS